MVNRSLSSSWPGSGRAVLHIVTANVFAAGKRVCFSTGKTGARWCGGAVTDHIESHTSCGAVFPPYFVQ